MVAFPDRTLISAGTTCVTYIKTWKTFKLNQTMRPSSWKFYLRRSVLNNLLGWYHILKRVLAFLFVRLFRSPRGSRYIPVVSTHLLNYIPNRGKHELQTIYLSKRFCCLVDYQLFTFQQGRTAACWCMWLLCHMQQHLRSQHIYKVCKIGFLSSYLCTSDKIFWFVSVYQKSWGYLLRRISQ